jgi:glutamate synthase (NADPH/NADH) small chain
MNSGAGCLPAAAAPSKSRASEFVLDVDTVIVAIGNESNPLIRQTTPGLKVDKHGHIIVNNRAKPPCRGSFAGGDIVLGAATVILAMGEGRAPQLPSIKCWPKANRRP